MEVGAAALRLPMLKLTQVLEVSLLARQINPRQNPVEINSPRDAPSREIVGGHPFLG